MSNLTFLTPPWGPLFLSDVIGPHKQQTTWPPLTRIFFAPISSFNTLHVHCYSKKPWSLIRAKVEVSPFFWKHEHRGVVRLTYPHHFKSEFKLKIWSRASNKSSIDNSASLGSKLLSWERKKNKTWSGQMREQHPFCSTSKIFSFSTYQFWS